MSKKAAASVNKSQAVRDLLAKNPDMMPKEIVATLKRSGVSLTPTFASILRSKFRNGVAKKSVKVAKPARAAAGGLDTLAITVAFIQRVGGLAAARQALSTIEQIKGL